MDDPSVNNTSNPVAAATGNVNNQAFQINNSSAPSRQHFSPGNSCNGATLTVSPFVTGGDTIPYNYQGYTRSNNWGLSLNVSTPLDGGMVEMCKALAQAEIDKERLDYELVRALKCTEILDAGYTFRPGSRVEVLCHDIIPIAALSAQWTTSQRQITSPTTNIATA